MTKKEIINKLYNLPKGGITKKKIMLDDIEYINIEEYLLNL